MSNYAKTVGISFLTAGASGLEHLATGDVMGLVIEIGAASYGSFILGEWVYNKIKNNYYI